MLLKLFIFAIVIVLPSHSTDANDQNRQNSLDGEIARAEQQCETSQFLRKSLKGKFDECRGNRSKRIIGGESVDIRNYPYQISMRWAFGIGQSFHFCGGSIVSKQHIVTAAHCVDRKRSPEIMSIIKVYSGTSRSDLGGKAHGIKSITVHPGFIRSNNIYVNDVAIVTLSELIEFSPIQQPIKLPTRQIDSGATATITGWGDTTHPNGETPIRLQEATMYLLASDQCQRLIPFPLESTQICAVASQGLGICSGDSGGPLASNGQLVGIASYVVECAKGHPDVYTNVYSYVDFIQETINVAV